MAQHYSALVLDVEVLVQPALAKAEQERLDKIKEETTQAAIEKIKVKVEEQGGEQNSGKLSFDDVFFLYFLVSFKHRHKCSQK